MIGTLARLFRHTVSYDRPDAILAENGGQYSPISSRELYRRVGKLFHELRAVGIGKGDRCALLSENRWEWAVADFAMMSAGVVSVPLYSTLPAEQLHYLLEHSEAKIVFVSTEAQFQKILSIWGRLPKLEGIVAFDEIASSDERVACLGRLLGESPLTAEEVEGLEASISGVSPGDLASIIYTSGTTGTPKGVMLTHGNIASNVEDSGTDIAASDIGLSFLPLSHVAERCADYIFFFTGASVAYCGSLDAVPKSMAAVQPTVALGVPRFFEKVHGKVMAAVTASSPLRQKLFKWAFEAGTASMGHRLAGRPLPLALKIKHGLADALVFAKLRGRLGGRLKRFYSGAAPLAKHLAEFFYVLGIPIYEAYGLTETSPLISVNNPADFSFGTVGKVIQNVEVKIAPDGEILVRGPNIMRGYYKMEEQTAATIVNGWFHTGDIGEFDKDGFLKITDRKKDLLKTSGGKYIAPQPIENLLKSCDHVSMAVVIAEGRNFPSALIVPNFERLKQYAAGSGIAAGTDGELARNEKVRALIEGEVIKACEPLAQYERVKRVYVVPREFSLEDGEITPTMKVKRKAVEQHFKAEIDKLYG